MDVIDRIEDELARQGARLDELRELIDLVGRYLDHVHDDVIGVREQMRLYNPKCYEAATDETPAPAQED
jgi:hypothetical protein